jgi:singapore isolate B (sub-type 7) whole genome shotgun sequence assembly, scaffold_5
MRRYIGNKAFKGTINVEFNSKEEAEEFMKKTIMFAGKEITDKQFLSEREKEIEEKSVVTEVCWLPLETIQL